MAVASSAHTGGEPLGSGGSTAPNPGLRHGSRESAPATALGDLPTDHSYLDIPAFLADPLRQRAGRVENATALFMHPGSEDRKSVV